jgi:hypothetical protein
MRRTALRTAHSSKVGSRTLPKKWATTEVVKGAK